MDGSGATGMLGEVIRRRRRELGWSQEELAARIGDDVRQSDVSRLETGKVSLPRRDRLERIATALDLSLGDLLARSGWAGAEVAFGAATAIARGDVLVVDDEPAVVDVLAGLLGDEGYDVRRAYDGVAALAEVERARPALVVADVMMPGLGGIALAGRLRTGPEPVPVVLIGASGRDPRLPGVPFVAKPFDVERVLGVVATAIGAEALTP